MKQVELNEQYPEIKSSGMSNPEIKSKWNEQSRKQMGHPDGPDPDVANPHPSVLNFDFDVHLKFKFYSQFKKKTKSKTEG